MGDAMLRLFRRVMLGAASLVLACMPLVWLAERSGWSQRPIHLAQTFVAVPLAFLSGALFLGFGRSAEEGRAWRPLAWVIVVASGLWLAFLAYVLWFADFSWMDQA